MLKNARLYETAEMADLYSTFRPVWDTQLFMDTIIDFCRDKNKDTDDLSLALDIGCGSGQSSIQLVPYFERVIGVDISAAMIAKAPTHVPTLSYRVGPGEDLTFVSDGSVDLVLVAVAAHFLDTPKFHAEVLRVLKPGGVLAILSYKLPSLDKPAAQSIIEEFDDDVMQNYAPFNYKEEAQKLLRDYVLPFPVFQRFEDLVLEKTWTVDELMGLLCSWTPSHLKCLKEPKSPKHFIRRRLQEVYGDMTGSERIIHVTFLVTLMMGDKPRIVQPA